jgi:hypothetical protein
MRRVRRPGRSLEPTRALARQDRLHEALAAIPGVTVVGASSALPLTAAASQTDITIPGAPGNTGDAKRDWPLADYIGTRAGSVEAMGVADDRRRHRADPAVDSIR